MDFTDFVGMEKEKRLIRLVIENWRGGDILPHFLFYGPPGCGKTTMAEIISDTTGLDCIRAVGGAIDETVMSNIFKRLFLEGPKILFIDEIHALPVSQAEALYEVMDKRAFTFCPNGGETFRVNCKNFALIGTTTEPGRLPKPLLDRFSIKISFDLYTQEQLSEIVKRVYSMTDNAALIVARLSQGTPRIAKSIAWLANSIATNCKRKIITEDDVAQAKELLGILEDGITKEQYRYLEFLSNSEKPIGQRALAVAANVDEKTLVEYIEPYLVRSQYVIKTTRGRTITEKGVMLLARIKNKE